MKLYFAHPKSTYNTPEEAAILEYLEKTMKVEVLNPSSLKDKINALMPKGSRTEWSFRNFNAYRVLGLGCVFFPAVRECQGLVAWDPIRDNRTAEGTWAELQHARGFGLPCWLIESTNGQIRRRKLRPIKEVREPWIPSERSIASAKEVIKDNLEWKELRPKVKDYLNTHPRTEATYLELLNRIANLKVAAKERYIELHQLGVSRFDALEVCGTKKTFKRFMTNHPVVAKAYLDKEANHNDQ